LAVGITAVVAVLWWPRLRSWLASRAWAVLIQHRLRSAFRGAALASWSGRIPAILWTTPRSAGVRVVLSLPAGLALADVQELREVLAAACFASDVHVDRHLDYSNIVVLFVVRRRRP
jgi:hypothetical protein